MNKPKINGKARLTNVCALHYAKLLLRLAIFITLLVLYVLHHVRGGDSLETVIESRPLLLVAIWAVFVVEMVLRFFPSRFESPGLQKQFARNYVKTGCTDIRIEIIRRAVEEPLRMIVENAGLEGSVVVNEVKNGKGDYGYNARAEKYENLFQSGVIDPAKEREPSELSPCGP